MRWRMSCQAVEDQDPVRTLFPHGAYPPLGEGVRFWIDDEAPRKLGVRLAARTESFGRLRTVRRPADPQRWCTTCTGSVRRRQSWRGWWSRLRVRRQLAPHRGRPTWISLRRAIAAG